MPDAGHGEAGEHADGVEGDQAVDLAPVKTSRGAMATTASTRMPLENDQAVAAPGQLAGQEGVLGHEAGEEREAVEAGVAAGVEDEDRGQLDHVEEDVADPGGAEHEWTSWETTVGVPAA